MTSRGFTEEKMRPLIQELLRPSHHRAETLQSIVLLKLRGELDFIFLVKRLRFAGVGRHLASLFY